MFKKFHAAFCLTFLFANLFLGVVAQHKSIDQKVDSVLRIMTLEEKIGQQNQYNDDWTATGPVTIDNDKANQIRKGQVGSLLNCKGTARTRSWQKVAMQSRLRIPLLFGQDVIHGYKTTFPIPLAEACSWDLDAMDMSDRMLWEVYLPPFKAALDAGAATFMNSFNDLNGVPATGNSYLQRDILKGKWGFKGFVVSDCGSIGEMINHGNVKNEYEAALSAITAGCDMDMESRIYKNNLAQLVKDKKVPLTLIDDAVRRILRKKFELGLFDDPYKYCNAELLYAKGCEIEGQNKEGFAEAVKIAKKAEVVILSIGERRDMSGEAKSRSNIDIPGVQEDLLKELLATGKPVVVLINAGRPLVFNYTADNAPAILYTWWLGSEAGNALADVLFGDYNPSAKLPISFPRSVGQIPIYYSHFNTGRPAKNDADRNYRSAYIDLSISPKYAFG